MTNHVFRIDHFHIMRQLDIASQDSALAFLFQGQHDTVATMQLKHYALEVEEDVDDILAHAIKRGILMQNASDSHFGRSIARHRRQQDTAQRIAQGMGIAALERLHRHASVSGGNRLYVDQTRFQKFRSAVLHSHSLRASDYLE